MSDSAHPDLLALAQRLSAIEETLERHGVRLDEHHRALGTGQAMATERLERGIVRVEKLLARMADHWGMPLADAADEGGG